MSVHGTVEFTDGNQHIRWSIKARPKGYVVICERWTPGCPPRAFGHEVTFRTLDEAKRGLALTAKAMAERMARQYAPPAPKLPAAATAPPIHGDRVVVPQAPHAPSRIIKITGSDDWDEATG